MAVVLQQIDHLGGYGGLLLAAAVDHALQGGHVAVVPPPGDGDVAIIGAVVVGGVEVRPAETGVVDGESGMRGIGADELGVAGWGQGLEIVAGVARGQAMGAQAGMAR